MSIQLKSGEIFKKLNKVKLSWVELLKTLSIDVESEIKDSTTDSFIYSLCLLPVSAISKFYEMKWDFNKDVLNPAPSVRGAHLKIDFGKYNIPQPIVIELKILAWVVLKHPEVFEDRGPRKPHTDLYKIKSTLRFLEHVVKVSRDKYGEDYVDSTYAFLSQIPQIDFEEAAASFTFKMDSKSGVPEILKYGNSIYARDVLGIKINVDYETLEEFQPDENIKPRAELYKKEYLKSFSSRQFNMLTKKATFLILQYLEVMNPGEDLINVANDKLGASHYSALNNLFKELEVDFTKDYVLQYFAYRLYRGKWGREYIKEVLPNVDLKYKFPNSIPIRDWTNHVYWACCYIINQFSAMRPNAAATVNFDTPLGEQHGIDLLMSIEHKGKQETYALFDDAYPMIPLMKDAWFVAKELSTFKMNPFLFSSHFTMKPGQKVKPMKDTGFIIQNFFDYVYPNNNVSVSSYTCRHTLVKELHRADIGLPVISYLLKHIVESVKKYSTTGVISDVTLSYGDLAARVNGTASDIKDDLRKEAEIELLKETLNPNAIYLGNKANEHKATMTKAFNGYMAAGYTEDEIYEAMVEQGFALLNVGTGMCFADDAIEDFDESLPCIGSLRCNPIRCKNSVITPAHAPKWREIYVSNLKLVGADGYEDRQVQISAIVAEAKDVLQYLGEDVF